MKALRERPAPPPGRDASCAAPPLLWLLAALVLGTAFVTGGSSTETGRGVLVAQWLALPLMVWASWLAWQRGRLRTARAGVALVLLALLLPALQLLPLPAQWWLSVPTRAALAADLAAFDVGALDYRWTLAPDATERDLYLLLPAVALFLAALALRAADWQRLLWTVVGLVSFSVLLAFLQLGAAQDSVLNPFPQYAPMLTGVFASKNHQASAMAVGLVLVLSLFLAHLQQPRDRLRLLICGALIVLLASVLPLVKSRAGVIIALLACGMIVASRGLPRQLDGSGTRAGRVAWVLALAGAALGTWGALAWMQSDIGVDGSRWEMAAATLRLGLENAPFGSGFGSFVPMFEQATAGGLMRSGYINNAHNDYAQLWFEGGLLAVLALAFALVTLVRALIALLTLRPESAARNCGLAAFWGLAVLLLHSAMDYPLRTPALLAVFGLLAGIMIAAAGEARQRARAHEASQRSRMRRSSASERRPSADSAPPLPE